MSKNRTLSKLRRRYLSKGRKPSLRQEIDSFSAHSLLETYVEPLENRVLLALTFTFNPTAATPQNVIDGFVAAGRCGRTFLPTTSRSTSISTLAAL